MRIAILGESYLPYRSGVTFATDALARGLVAAGQEVMLAVPRPRDPAPPVAGLRFSWLPSYQLPAIAPPGYRMPLPGAWRRTFSELLAFRPDVVHAQSPFTSGALAARVARRAGAPLVFTHHTRFADYRHYLGPLARPGAALTDAYLHRFWRRCAAIVAPSRYLADEIGATLSVVEGAPPLIRVIPTGLDLAAIRALEARDPRPLAGWAPDDVVVVSLGRLAREKSVEDVVRAATTASALVPQIRLLLIGGGPLERSLRRRAASSGGALFVAGAMPRFDALALLKGADLFAFASRSETQGLVLAEALSCGLPVVAREGPAIAESVRDGVDGVLASDLDALAESLAALARDPERRATMRLEASAGADRFDERLRIDEVLRLYRRACRRSALRRCAVPSRPGREPLARARSRRTMRPCESV